MLRSGLVARIVPSISRSIVFHAAVVSAPCGSFRISNNRRLGASPIALRELAPHCAQLAAAGVEVAGAELVLVHVEDRGQAGIERRLDQAVDAREAPRDGRRDAG